MTEDEMQDYIELFDDDGNDPIYSFWDVRTDDKRLLIASHNPVLVYRYIILSELATAEEKQDARRILGLAPEEEEERQPIENDRPVPPIATTETFLVAEVDWGSLSDGRRKELMGACGYWEGMSKEPWGNLLPHAQVLLARELERISGGTATFVHDEIMEELRHEPGWEAKCDPRLQCKPALPSEAEAPQPQPSSTKKRRPRVLGNVTPPAAKSRKAERKRKK
jgi:hypothetical protein